MNEESELYEKLIRSIEKVNKEQTKELKDYINKEVQSIKEKIQEETQKRIELENKYIELNTKYAILEKALKKNNIVIFGIQADKVENISSFIISKLNNILELDLIPQDVNNAYTIGKQQQHKPIVVQFVSYFKKIEVLKNCKKLKGTGISISQDLNLEERKQVQILRRQLKIAREQNQNAYIRGNRLYVNGEVYTAEQLQETEEDILENNIDKQEENKVRSAPSTPTIRKRQEIEQEYLEEEDIQSDPKKKKLHPTTATKSSARIASKLK